MLLSSYTPLCTQTSYVHAVMCSVPYPCVLLLTCTWTTNSPVVGGTTRKERREQGHGLTDARTTNGDISSKTRRTADRWHPNPRNLATAPSPCHNFGKRSLVLETLSTVRWRMGAMDYVKWLDLSFWIPTALGVFTWVATRFQKHAVSWPFHIYQLRSIESDPNRRCGTSLSR